MQAFGQALWCLAHTLWVGNSFMMATSLGLMAHHAFGCWHGDRRLADKYGEAFEKVGGQGLWGCVEWMGDAYTSKIRPRLTNRAGVHFGGRPCGTATQGI